MYNKSTKKKIIHVIILIIVFFVVLSAIGLYILRYQVRGESNLPFNITKIIIAQSVDGTENLNQPERWNLLVSENNDIYIYLEKNSKYNKTEIIESIDINNIAINKNNTKGEAKFYKPVVDENTMFKNLEENEITQISYIGDLESNIKEQKISNQGGIVAFRYGINNISNYISNESEEIDYSKLLQLTNIMEDDIKTTLTFDIIINLTTGKKYQSNIQLEVPAKDVIEKGTNGIEITDLSNLVFKRIDN